MLVNMFSPTHLLRAYQTLRYHGNLVTCSCCHGNWSAFLPGGVQKRPNAACPRCGALERHRFFAHLLRQRGNVFAGKRVLHVAPEPVISSIIQEQVPTTYTTVDLAASPAIDVVADITALPFYDALFDMVVCNHVLEHVTDDLAAMRELRRVLAADGIAILSQPIDWTRATTEEDPSCSDPAERIRRFGQSDHVRLYGADILGRLQSADFSCEILKPSEMVDDVDMHRYGFKSDESLLWCRPTSR